MSGMTDQEALNTIDAYLPRHCRAALDHIAARLRGDGEQYPEAAEVCGEAYQVVGSLLDDLGVFEHPHAQKALDNLSQHRMVHTDVLPWPSFAALSTQPAPSEQVAASVAVPDEATIDRLAHEAYEIHCNTPIGHFPNDSNLPKWRAVVRHVLAAAPVAPESGRGACGDGCEGRGACRVADESPAVAPEREG